MATRPARTGVRRGSRVGVQLTRSVTLPVTLLATWRRGAAHVPLEPTLPHHRLAAQASAAEVDAIVADDPVPRAQVQVITPQSPGGSVPTDPVTTGADLAYVIFTSGSTRLPRRGWLSPRIVRRTSGSSALARHRR